MELFPKNFSMELFSQNFFYCHELLLNESLSFNKLLFQLKPALVTSEDEGNLETLSVCATITNKNCLSSLTSPPPPSRKGALKEQFLGRHGNI